MYRRDAVADLRAAVGRDGAFDLALVVIDEQAAGHEIRQALLEQLALEGRGYGVGGAGADLPLVVDLRAVGAQVDAGRQVFGYGLGGCEHEIAHIGEIGLPAVAGDAAGGGVAEGVLVVVVRHGEGSGSGECCGWGEV